MKKKSILIVDDEPNIRNMLTRYLSREYDVHVAADGQEAFDTVSENNDIELILSDVKMPHMDGLELFSKVQESKKDIKTIFITGTSTVQSAVDAMRKGAFDYLTKPVDVSRLESSIKEALQRKRKNMMSCNSDDNPQ
jgi:DNA-binding NtrC family response regulator